MNFTLEKESPLGARAQLRSLPGGLSPADPLAAVSLYLGRLSPSGRRTQLINLERASRVLGGAGLNYDWSELWSGHLEFLIGALKGEGLSASTINSTVSAVRGVARWAWHLGQMPHEQYERLRVGLDPFTAHDLRRSLGAHLRKKVGLEVAQAVLGHTDIQVTQVYLMVEEEGKRAAMLKVRVSFRAGGKGKRRRRRRRRKS